MFLFTFSFPIQRVNTEEVRSPSQYISEGENLREEGAPLMWFTF